MNSKQYSDAVARVEADDGKAAVGDKGKALQLERELKRIDKILERVADAQDAAANRERKLTQTVRKLESDISTLRATINRMSRK